VLFEDDQAVREHERIFRQLIDEARAAPTVGRPPVRQSAAKVVLHVGCGSPDPRSLHPRFAPSQWKEIRLDVNAGVAPDVVASITDMAAVPTASVDAVWSSHNIEHLYAHEVPLALGEFFRVLKPGGFALITLPDIQQVARHIAEGKLEEPLYVSPAGPISALDVVFGHRESLAKGNHYMAHNTGFTAETLCQKLKAAGFRKVDVRREKLALWAEAYK